MKKVIYYSSTRALREALEFANELGGLIVDEGEIDDKSHADENPEFRQKVGCWSGTLACYNVIDDNGQIVAKFGYWE